MTMSAREIALSYKTAKDKKNQITVLADLNCCSKDEIKNILAAEGITVVTSKSANRAAVDTPTVIPEQMINTKAVRSNVPKWVLMASNNRLNELSDMIRTLQEQIIELSSEQMSLQEWLEEVGKV